MKTLLLCANGLEECEALVTHDLLLRAGIDSKLVGLSKNIISTHNLHFEVDDVIDNVDYKEFDALILPGGMPGTTNLENSAYVQEAIDYFMQNKKIIAAICAAPMILIHKGYLKDREFTCFPGCEEGLVRLNEKVVQKENIITSNGLGGAFEFAAKIISALCGDIKAMNVLMKIQY